MIGAQGQEVVVVPAHRLRGEAGAGVVERLQRGPGLGEEPGLDLPRNRQLVNGAALGFELLGHGAAPRLHGMSDLVEADEGEGVPIDVAEARGNAAPHRGLVPEQPGRRRGRGGCRVVLDPPEPR